ncbi:hypothetical protein LSAT2_010940 [Lamellibrachia satsuma]|nr:hypothetical protein LSAT2_010940 [Lamellibrachia satsuma]
MALTFLTAMVATLVVLTVHSILAAESIEGDAMSKCDKCQVFDELCHQTCANTDMPEFMCYRFCVGMEWQCEMENC